MAERIGEAELLRDADVAGAWMIVNGGTEQSWVDPADPTHLEFDYAQRIKGPFPYRLVHGEVLKQLIAEATAATDAQPAHSPDPRPHKLGM